MKRIVIAGLLLAGCSTEKGSWEYYQGTECLGKCDYQGAKIYLMQAVKEDPSSKNLTNLAAAYVGLGDKYKAWQTSCRAVVANFGDKVAIQGNMELFLKYIVPSFKLDDKDHTIETIKECLGKPDMAVINKETEEAYLMYGAYKLKFIKGQYQGYEIRYHVDYGPEWIPLDIE